MFEAGKAIISHATQPFNHGGRDYYFVRQISRFENIFSLIIRRFPTLSILQNEENYRGRQGVPVCKMPMDQLVAAQSPAAAATTTVAPVAGANGTVTAASSTPDQILSTMTFPDGRRPREVS